MWCKLKSRVSAANIDKLLSRANGVLQATDATEIAFSGKDFFGSDEAGNGNFDLLKQFHLDLWPEISDEVEFSIPVIDHSYLLVKSPGGARTRMHQDRPYWIRKEVIPTIFSVWIALEDMSEENGGLILSRRNEVDVADISSFNTGAILAHQEVVDSSGTFPLLIPDKIASALAKSMEFIDMAKGEAVAFDSFEPHMSRANTTASPRIAMKIAYAEGDGKAHYLTRVDDLERKDAR